MRILTLLVVTFVVLATSVASAQSQVRFLSIPSSGFTPQTSEGAGDAGYGGNQSGTARLFNQSSLLFAPVTLPDGATVTSMRCGGHAPPSNFRITFVLRRNDPQQANVDMATVMTTFDAGFQFVETSSITSPLINNRRFNYYIVALADNQDVGFCPNCSVGFCGIGYTDN